MAVVAGLLALGAPVAEAAAPRCPAAKLTVVVDGKRSCKARSAGRAIRPTASFTAQIVGGLLGDPLVSAPSPRLDNGQRLAPAIPPALAGAARRGFAQAEAAAHAAAEELAKPAAQRRLASVAVPMAGPVTTISKPAVSGSFQVDPKTGSGRGTIGVELTSTTGKASATLGVDLEIGVNAGEAATLGGKIRVTTDDGSGLRRTSIGGGTVTMSQGAVCPDATGRIEWKNRTGTTNTSSVRQRIGPINVGAVATTFTIKTQITAIGQMSGNAELESISYTVVVDADYSHAGQALAFFQSRTRVKGKGTAAGRLDPKTGQPLAGASVNIATSGAGDELAKARGEVAQELEKALREVLGDIQKQMKDAEQRAQGGECTKIDTTPSAPADMEIGQSGGVQTDLLTNSGHKVKNVRWTATATKGSVTPPTSVEDDGRGRFTVTTVGPGPEIQSMKLRAVSPAGISEAVWTARETLPEVLLVSIDGKQTSLAGQLEYVWKGTARLVRSHDPRVTSTAAWTVDALTIGSFTATIPGDCTGVATYAGSPDIRGGSLDLVDDPAGSRGYRLNIAWTSTTSVPMVFTGDCSSSSTPFQVAASALSNDLTPLPTTTTRPFAGFPFDDTFTATDTGWTYQTTVHVAPEP